MAVFYKGDAVQMLKKHLKDKSVDMIYFDPPFATTGNWWDEEIDWTQLFEECFRVLKDSGTLVIHCSVPFNYTLIRAAPRPPSYSWYWKKNIKTNFLNCKSQPLRCMEEVLVWKMKKTTYHPQMIGDEIRILPKNTHKNNRYFETNVQSIDARQIKGHYPTHLLEMPIELNEFSTRPTAMVDHFIKSYTAEGQIVLDLTCYKGLSGLVAKRLNRRWIGIDKYHLPKLLI